MENVSGATVIIASPHPTVIAATAAVLSAIVALAALGASIAIARSNRKSAYTALMYNQLREYLKQHHEFVERENQNPTSPSAYMGKNVNPIQIMTGVLTSVVDLMVIVSHPSTDKWMGYLTDFKTVILDKNFPLEVYAMRRETVAAILTQRRKLICMSTSQSETNLTSLLSSDVGD